MLVVQVETSAADPGEAHQVLQTTLYHAENRSLGLGAKGAPEGQTKLYFDMGPLPKTACTKADILKPEKNLQS